MRAGCGDHPARAPRDPLSLQLVECREQSPSLRGGAPGLFLVGDGPMANLFIPSTEKKKRAWCNVRNVCLHISDRCALSPPSLSHRAIGKASKR